MGQIDKALILKREEENDGKTIYLYYNETVGFYTAFGLSAFYVTHVTDPVVSFSDEMQLPVVMVPKRQILELRQSLKKVEHEIHKYYHFETRMTIGDKKYAAWVEGIRQRRKQW